MAYPPYDPGADSGLNGSRQQPIRAVTLHRTVGSWPGDYSVGKTRHHSSPGTFNFLIGQGFGEAVMFYPPTVRCSHAAGSNRAGPGIEFSGQNGSPLTDWQVSAGGELIRALAHDYRVPFRFYDGPRIAVDGSAFAGFVNHASVATEPQYQHYDFVTRDEFDRMIGVTPTAQGDDMPAYLYILEATGAPTGWVLADGTGYVWVDQRIFNDIRNRGQFGIVTIEQHVTNPTIANTIAKRAGTKP